MQGFATLDGWIDFLSQGGGIQLNCDIIILRYSRSLLLREEEFGKEREKLMRERGGERRKRKGGKIIPGMKGMREMQELAIK